MSVVFLLFVFFCLVENICLGNHMISSAMNKIERALNFTAVVEYTRHRIT